MKYLHFTTKTNAHNRNVAAYRKSQPQIDDEEYAFNITKTHCSEKTDDSGATEIHICEGHEDKFTALEQSRMTDTPTISFEE